VLIAVGYALYVHFKRPAVPVTNGIVVPNVTAAQLAAQQQTQQTAGQALQQAAVKTVVNTASNLLNGAVNDWVHATGTSDFSNVDDVGSFI
jgi:hypothetical protein